MFIVNAFIIPHHLLLLNLGFLKTIKFLQMIHACNDINMTTFHEVQISSVIHQSHTNSS